MDRRAQDELVTLARPLEDEASLDPLIERIGGSRIVMLGEATHGTREFYEWRTRITMMLVREKGFRYGEDAQRYALATEVVPADCRVELSTLLAQGRRAVSDLSASSIEAGLDIEQNAVTAVNAETYYRTSSSSSETRADSWSRSLTARSASSTIDETRAVRPLHVPVAQGQTPETFPWGV